MVLYSNSSGSTLSHQTGIEFDIHNTILLIFVRLTVLKDTLYIQCIFKNKEGVHF